MTLYFAVQDLNVVRAVHAVCAIYVLYRIEQMTVDSYINQTKNQNVCVCVCVCVCKVDCG